MGTSSHRLSKVGLATGFLGLLVAVVVAHQTPATGYELSIYRDTPTAVWAGLVAAFTAGTVVSLLGPRTKQLYGGALLLIGSAALAMFTLPIIRGYEFYGRGDSLSHAGWAREIGAGALDPGNLLYPGIHTLTVFVQSVAGVEITVANMYVVLLVFPLLFLLFVPLSVQLLGGGSRGLAIGLLAAALFIPINNVSVHPVAHPATQGIFFFSFVLYLLLAYVIDPVNGGRSTDRLAVTDGGRRGSWWRDAESGVTGVGVLLATASLAIVLIHPQQAVNVTLAFIAITFVQLGARRWVPDHPLASHQALTAQTLVLVAAVSVWAPRFDRVTGTIVALIGGLFRTGATTGQVVSQKSASLTTLGGSLPELFFKLFFPALVFSLLATGIIVVALRRFADAPARNSLVAYIAAGLVPLFGIFLLMVVVQSGDQYFRYVGFIMVPVTVLGATALSRWLYGLDADTMRPVGAIALVVLMLVLLPVGVAATHPSPHIYQPNSQVTESEFSGYEATFDHREEEVAFTGVRGGPRRFVDFYYGTERAMNTLEFPGYRTPLGEQTFVKANYSDAFEEPRYMAVSESTYEREVTLYDGFRYPERSFEALEATPSVNRVRSSDGFDLYRIDGDEDDA